MRLMIFALKRCGLALKTGSNRVRLRLPTSYFPIRRIVSQLTLRAA